MKLTITFDLPKDLTIDESETFREDIGAAAVKSIQDIFEYRGREAAEQVAASIEAGETQ